jgi:16S rRNA (uracil1498-N3)-methyltransferase
MPLSFFYDENLNDTSLFTLSEETSKHIIQVLRMKKGEQLQLTNGKGKVLTAQIISEHKRSVEVRILSSVFSPQSPDKITIAISLIKNNNRFEWFLEKATEIGVSAIIPLICERTEKQNFRYDRMKNILVSAMLQSQQAWLPELHQATKFTTLIKTSSQQKYIAHCIDEKKQTLTNQLINQSTDVIILIGPEGDFTKQEINLAIENNFIPVSLGNTRLRTETAGVVAAVLLNQ